MKNRVSEVEAVKAEAPLILLNENCDLPESRRKDLCENYVTPGCDVPGVSVNVTPGCDVPSVSVNVTPRCDVPSVSVNETPRCDVPGVSESGRVMPSVNVTRPGMPSGKKNACTLRPMPGFEERRVSGMPECCQQSGLTVLCLFCPSNQKLFGRMSF
ncbi:MAG: hypothetical protein GY696_14175 [Gammaproteobacteria bacterium]|nr:hypothetical protein [Gammaproteobacteria bacterium]